MGTGTPAGSPLLQGGLASTPTAPSEGPKDETCTGQEVWRGLCQPGDATQNQTCKGKCPLVLHLKTKNLEKIGFRK